jgi:hypothetical protein
MGQRNAGLVRAGFRRAHAPPAAAAAVAEEDWADSVKRRMLTLAGIPAERAAFHHEDFMAGTGTSFPGWVRSSTGTGSLTHSTTRRGGVVRFLYTSGFVTYPHNYLAWDGDQVFADGFDERFGIAFRMRWQATPAGPVIDPNGDARFGANSPAGGNQDTFFGVTGSLSTTNFVLQAGTASLVLPTTIASFGLVEKEVMLVDRPDALVSAVICLVDGIEVGRLARTEALFGRVPWLGTNYGDLFVDDVAWVTSGGLS